jgi:cell division protein FtsQ
MKKQLLFKKQRKRSGASTVRRGPSRRKLTLPSLPSLYPLVMTGLLVTVSLGVYQGVEWLTGLSVDRVAISGEFRQVQREPLTKLVEPFLDEGFLLVDLEGIRQQLEAVPWIYQVSVKRQWPDQLVIHVTEQTAIARWDKQGFINHRGEFFAATETVFIKGLPLLQGPVDKASEMMVDYRDLGELLRQQGLVLTRLSMDERGNWSAVLDSGVTIVLGSDQVMEKVQRFVLAYQRVLSEKFEKVKRIDMRYSNGLAVAWRSV